MDGIRIFIHAIRMVLGNVPTAIRIGGLLFVVMVLGTIAAGPEAMMSGNTSAADGQMPEGAGAQFVLLFAQIILGLWLAVSWHRFILLEEVPGRYGPQWNGSAIWGYFKAGFIVALVVMVAVIPMFLIGGLLVFPMFMADPMNPSLFGAFVVFLVVYLPGAYIGYRLAPILPSAAIGERMSLSEAWYATSTSGASFLVLAFVSLVVSWMISLPGQLLLSTGLSILGLAWIAAVQWGSMIVGASILTTIYGHYVQKRDLNA